LVNSYRAARPRAEAHLGLSKSKPL